MNVQINGLDAVRGMTERFISSIPQKIAAGVAKGAEEVCAEAKELCPVDTGALRDSIYVQHGFLSAQVGTDLEYAPCVEFGTYKMAAQPFLVPALKAKEGEIINNIKNEIMKG